MSSIDTTIVMIAWSPDDYRLKLLRQTLASLRAHTSPRYRLVIVDNGPAAQTEVIEAAEPDVHIRHEVNTGIGKSRNEGASTADTEYLIFTDSDIGFFPGWLDACIGVLEAHPDRKLIATPVKNRPMRMPKHHVGTLGEYELYNRCAGMCLVMRLATFKEVGPFDERRTNVGDRFCRSVRIHRYLFVHHPTWAGRHLGRARSYHYKKQVFDPRTGLWMPKTAIQESTP